MAKMLEGKTAKSVINKYFFIIPPDYGLELFLNFTQEER